MDKNTIKRIVVAGAFVLAAFGSRGAIQVSIEHNDNDDATSAFDFKKISRPAPNDAATAAKFEVLDGEIDPNSGGLARLNDGKLPTEADEPSDNFFFQAGTKGGRVRVDLGNAIHIRQVNTYSWHPGSRGPQVYKLYAAAGSETGFTATPAPHQPPEQSGWQLVASVNTKPKTGDGGGQYGVNIVNPDGNLGHYRFLLFDIAPTEFDDAFGNTFYSEVDVIDANAPITQAAPTETPVEAFTVETTDGNNTITINTSQAPALKEWAEKQLAPVLAEWYPKIVAMLPSPGYTAPSHFKITIKPMGGVAYTSGRNVAASSAWLQREIHGEAVGSLVHEAVHVVQQFHSRRNPGWLVEGSADYIRWFKYEPQSHGADLVWMKKHGPNFSPHYNDSYRITANFLNWVSEKYDADLVPKMNAAMREGKYDADLWKKYTGKTASELGEEWRNGILEQLGRTDASPKP